MTMTHQLYDAVEGGKKRANQIRDRIWLTAARTWLINELTPHGCALVYPLQERASCLPPSLSARGRSDEELYLSASALPPSSSAHGAFIASAERSSAPGRHRHPLPNASSTGVRQAWCCFSQLLCSLSDSDDRGIAGVAGMRPQQLGDVAHREPGGEQQLGRPLAAECGKSLQECTYSALAARAVPGQIRAKFCKYLRVRRIWSG